KGRGWIFTPKDFVDLGSRAAVDQALLRLKKDGSQGLRIRRLARGLYDYPRRHPVMGILSPDPDAVARALAKRTGSRLMPSASKAANMLGLSTQVPAQNVYLTDGRSKTVKVGKQVVRLKHAAPSKMAFADSPNANVMQALRSIGRKNVGDDVVKQIARAVPRKTKDDFIRLSPVAPDWTRPIMKRIASE
ncbi:MAG: DUF6088 family protein, partial [Terracidiphilus sp.]